LGHDWNNLHKICKQSMQDWLFYSTYIITNRLCRHGILSAMIPFALSQIFCFQTQTENLIPM
jgi:hypothetical protein